MVSPTFERLVAPKRKVCISKTPTWLSGKLRAWNWWDTNSIQPLEEEYSHFLRQCLLNSNEEVTLGGRCVFPIVKGPSFESNFLWFEQLSEAGNECLFDQIIFNLFNFKDVAHCWRGWPIDLWFCRSLGIWKHFSFFPQFPGLLFFGWLLTRVMWAAGPAWSNGAVGGCCHGGVSKSDVDITQDTKGNKKRQVPSERIYTCRVLFGFYFRRNWTCLFCFFVCMNAFWTQWKLEWSYFQFLSADIDPSPNQNKRHQFGIM